MVWFANVKITGHWKIFLSMWSEFPEQFIAGQSGEKSATPALCRLAL
jgi:hypothetical protein